MTIHIWRHPKPKAADGICIGQEDIAVDRRKIKRLANRIERFVRLHKLPKVIWVSPLQRSLKIGEVLAERGFTCLVAAELSEINFGDWDGRPWSTISKREIDNWCSDFAHFAPTNGESLQQLFDRVVSWSQTTSSTLEGKPILAVGHAGWINAAKLIDSGQEIPETADQWPSAVGYGEYSQLRL
ncbi:MAG: histidine phosphatase family protein [Psychrobacter sp.]